MNEKEALTRVKTGNFNGGHGFDLQLLVDAVGIIGEMFKSGQISEVVRCKECKYFYKASKYCSEFMTMDEDGFCKWGERREE